MSNVKTKKLQQESTENFESIIHVGCKDFVHTVLTLKNNSAEYALLWQVLVSPNGSDWVVFVPVTTLAAGAQRREHLEVSAYQILDVSIRDASSGNHAKCDALLSQGFCGTIQRANVTQPRKHGIHIGPYGQIGRP